MQDDSNLLKMPSIIAMKDIILENDWNAINSTS